MKVNTEYTEKELARLRTWKRWNAMMKMLRAIHREIEPKKLAMRVID